MELVRAGLANIISAASSFVVCAATGDYDDVPKLLERHRAHVMIVEPFHKSQDGIRWIKEFAGEFPQTKILVASSSAEVTYAERTLRAGAAGYWMKTSSADELLRAIETVLTGEVYVSPVITSLALRKFAGDRNVPPGLDVLSDREMAVFTLIAAEHGIGQIAKELGISRRTIETHCEHIKQKLGYRNAEELKRGARELLGERRVRGKAPDNSQAVSRGE